jgi:CheY-like chemotaxis protein
MSSRLLIVDDNAEFLEAAKDLLERQGCEVVAVASTGTEALRLARELQPDVALVDIDLGPESGFDVATRLAAGNGHKVVLISAYAEAEFADMIATSPALGFLPKAELSARAIGDVLDRAPREP